MLRVDRIEEADSGVLVGNALSAKQQGCGCIHANFCCPRVVISSEQAFSSAPWRRQAFGGSARFPTRATTASELGLPRECGPQQTGGSGAGNVGIPGAGSSRHGSMLLRANPPGHWNCWRGSESLKRTQARSGRVGASTPGRGGGQHKAGVLLAFSAESIHITVLLLASK